MKLSVKVVPGASCDGIVGWLGDRLKIRVTAPAEGGKANAAVKEVVASALSLPRAAVEIVAGNAAPRKVIEITGLSEAEIRNRLAAQDA